ncbi:hypothetical protein [Bacillus sp. SG-1]|uniref:hypothetical protein n=1 Tax=Bacillus sp. SG-1 TaxID=161544 RepID=UPI000154488E|nr:hypothetical protein [Bacillus sp. SG-1]EDL64077.1 hypothetical protein BSG1_12936 [Bacillus sp. SG-1]
MMKLTSTGKAILFCFLAAVLAAGCSSEEAGTNNQEENPGETQQSDNQAEQDEQQTDDNGTDTEEDGQQSEDSPEDMSLTKEEAADILQQYETTFMVETNEDGTVEAYETEEELLSHFKTIMSDELAQTYVDEFFREDSGQLKIIATEPPVWLNPEVDYEFNKKNETTYHVVQRKNSELRGDREYTFELKYQSNQWIVSEVSSEKLDQVSSQQIKEKADNMLHALLKKDMDTVAGFVHSKKGLLISPYVNLTKEDVVLKKQEVAGVYELNETYTWGYEAGSGKPIEATPKEYFQRYQDFAEFDKVIVDDIEQRGNVTMNIKEYFPDSQVVEFYKDGTEENSNMDWSSLYIVLQEDSEGEWKAVALVSGQWTI